MENPNGQIQLWPKGEAKKVFNSPINFSHKTGKSGNQAWTKLRAYLDA